MKKLFLLLAFVAVSATVASAQNYKSGIGLRLGWNSAIDYKMNISEKNSWEFNLSFPAFSGIEASAAYQWNFPFAQKGNGTGWNAYVGPAIEAGFLGVAGYRGVIIGVGGHGGVEYKFDIPLAIGIDYKPIFGYVLGDFRGPYYGGFGGIALVGRYCF